MKTDLKIDFQLLDTSIPPNEITKITGIIPDTELVQGERNKALNLPRQNIWSIESQADSDDIDDHWKNLKEIIQGSKDSLREIAKTGMAKFTIVINSNQRIPPISIPPAMSEFAGFINAVIDIDHLQ